MQLLLKNDAKPSLHQPVRYQTVSSLGSSYRSNFPSDEGPSTDYVKIGPIRNPMKFFLAAISDTLHFFLSALTWSLLSRLRPSGHHCTVEPSLSGHPRGTRKWPLNEGCLTTEVCHMLADSLAETSPYLHAIEAALLVHNQLSHDISDCIILHQFFFKKLRSQTIKYQALAGAHQMEPPSPIQALGVNHFPSRFIIRTLPRGDFARRRWEEPITTTKWQCCCTPSNSRKFGVDRPNTIIS